MLISLLTQPKTFNYDVLLNDLNNELVVLKFESFILTGYSKLCGL